MTPVVRTRQLTRYYPAVRSDPVKAVDAVDLELAAGEMAVVSGPSASGKTTLLGLIAGLDRPSSGRVELFGRAACRAVRRRLGFAPANPRRPGVSRFQAVARSALLGKRGLAAGAHGHAVAAAQGGPPSGSIGWGSPRSPIGLPSNSAAGSSSGWRWPGRW